jgi:HPt (histidine-containing phosphotransfer) domain-containing protein
VADLRAAVDGGQADAICGAAHRLAGFAAHFGLGEVAAQARRLEGAALAGDALSAKDAKAGIRAVRAAVRNLDWSPYAVSPEVAA